MKILMLMGGGDVGGAKTHIMSLCFKLAQNHTVKLVSFRDGEFPLEAKANGIDVETLPSINLFKAKKQLLKLIKNYNPDVIHSHGTRANLMSAMVKGKITIPTVATVHSDYKLDYLGNPLKQCTLGFANAMSLRMLDNYIAVADTMQQLLISRNFDPNKVMKIYNGIDFSEKIENINRFEFFEKFNLNIDENDVVLGIAARLTEVKDIPTLLKAFKISYEKNTNLRLMIAGDGEDLEKLTKMTVEMGISNRVHFIGWVSDIKSFFASIDINLLTSISETFPYSLLEGIMQKASTITSLVGGVHKMIDNEINGFIFNPRDFTKLSEYITILSNDKDLRKEFSTLLYKETSENFSLEKTCQDQISIYKRCVEQYKINQNKRSKITICGAYGKGNAGDDAILSAIVSEMRQIDENIPLCVMSRTPKNTKKEYFTDSIFTFDVFKFAKSFRKSKLYINGGGSLIQDITSSRSLYFYLFTLFLAKKMGAKVMMYGCGIGPVNKKINRRLATKIINKNVDVITLRDEISLSELQKMGVNKPKIVITADPTMSLPKSSESDVVSALQSAKVPDGVSYLGIGIRSWKGLENVNQEIALAIEYAYEKYNLVPVFLPIEHPSDIEPSVAISNLLKCPSFIVEEKQSTETTIGLFSKMDLVLGIRLHSLIFSAGNGVPVIGMSYDVKVDGFLKYIKSDACIDLSKVNASDMYELIDKAMTPQYKKQVTELSKELREKEFVNILQAKEILEV